MSKHSFILRFILPYKLVWSTFFIHNVFLKLYIYIYMYVCMYVYTLRKYIVVTISLGG